jgi:hypothetical protein
MKYKAVTATSIEEFNQVCNYAIEAGFIPVGTVAMCLGPGGNYTRYTQAFIYENSNHRQTTK